MCAIVYVLSALYIGNCTMATYYQCQPSGNNGSGGLSRGKIAGIVIAGIIIAGIVIAVIVLLFIILVICLKKQIELIPYELIYFSNFTCFY